MKSQHFTLRIEHPALAGPSRSADHAPLLVTGRCESLWHRPLWLHPSFWEVPETRNLATLPAAAPPASSSLLGRSAPVWVGLRLHSAGRGWTLQVSGQAARPPAKALLDEPLAFLLSDGQVNLPPFHIRLPPGLAFTLARDTHKRLHLELAHPTLGAVFSTNVYPSIQNAAKELLSC